MEKTRKVYFLGLFFHDYYQYCGPIEYWELSLKGLGNHYLMRKENAVSIAVIGFEGCSSLEMHKKGKLCSNNSTFSYN
ncbi:hypothetical protein HHL23_05970 [Chryseobacterium sp. RP-3-3]|uniref:Uncharacterized protein n=1 Tax=Chryseobacterium antibioticum TaxID=2728847 RepID=A0A7Y0AL34_9FLAO|nr:hypothetical protein [Chryseobacterium antibioticum]NML69338.1 hypothetical protein [Chryseobacterium antibioticum]